LEACSARRAISTGLLAHDDRQGRHVRLTAEHGKLLLCGRTLHVERRHLTLLAALLGKRLASLAVVVVLPDP
jgi:hypothetical protein